MIFEKIIDFIIELCYFVFFYLAGKNDVIGSLYRELKERATKRRAELEKQDDEKDI